MKSVVFYLREQKNEEQSRDPNLNTLSHLWNIAAHLIIGKDNNDVSRTTTVWKNTNGQRNMRGTHPRKSTLNEPQSHYCYHWCDNDRTNISATQWITRSTLARGKH